MDFFQILLLSIVQGITEFLPISSQSHLILTSALFNMKDQGLGFDIALHAGSLIAILIYYRNEINKMLSASKEGCPTYVASIPRWRYHSSSKGKIHNI